MTATLAATANVPPHSPFSKGARGRSGGGGGLKGYFYAKKVLRKIHEPRFGVEPQYDYCAKKVLRYYLKLKDCIPAFAGMTGKEAG
jgi:hypothetical protein